MVPVKPFEGNPPVIVAWSVTEVPTTTGGVGLIVVVIVGVCLLIVRGSQLPVVAVLLPSPLYVAENP